jgi:hypothetical protein
MFILLKHDFKFNSRKKISQDWQEKGRKLLLQRLISNDLELFVDLDIKLYLGTRENSLCLRPPYWDSVEVTLTLILHKFVITSAKPTENLKEITDISHC